MPEDRREVIIDLALAEPVLSPRELAVRYTEEQGYYVPEFTVSYCPRLLSDKEPSYVSGELREWLESQGMAHTRGTPYHHMTQGKIERYHSSIMNQVLLENYYLPGELDPRIKQFADYYNYERYQESLDSLTFAEVYRSLVTI